MEHTPTAAANFENLRVACVEKAKIAHPDLDFSSLDTHYDDILEPQLNFDPATDDVPEPTA